MDRLSALPRGRSIAVFGADAGMGRAPPNDGFAMIA
jgi:hypothetical protein